MKWFQGSIPEAIQLSKIAKSIFIVYVEGEDEQSKSMADTWDNSAVITACEAGHCVAVKINASSDDCKFFSQIYPVVVVPSVYFIGLNGVPLEISGGFIPPGTFVGTINTVVETHNSQCGESTSAAYVSSLTSGPVHTNSLHPETTSTYAVQPSQISTASGSKIPSDSLVNASERAKTESLEEQPLPLPVNEETSTSDLHPRDAQNVETSTTDLETRVDRAKEKIQEQQEKKREEEERNHREKELERRRLGKDMQRLKQYQDETKQKEILDQIRKDKEAERLARERVKEQIARDRAEQAKKYQKEKTEREEKAREAQNARLLAEQEAAKAADARRSQFARIQFRLPDGSTVTEQFSSSELLQTAYNFVRQRAGGEFTMATTFPKRTFSTADLAQTFMDLQLAPSAVIIVLPVGNRIGPSHEESSLFRTLWMLPIQIFSYLWNLLQLFFRSSSPTLTSPPSASQNSASLDATGGSRYQGHAQKRTSTTERQDGKIHRMTDVREDSDEDEQATWNGNSTQQM